MNVLDTCIFRLPCDFDGVYGAMFFSAVISAAFVEKDLDKLQLAENIYEAFKHYDAFHTNNNAALCVASLVFAK
jgi:hypothetical protein